MPRGTARRGGAGAAWAGWLLVAAVALAFGLWSSAGSAGALDAEEDVGEDLDREELVARGAEIYQQACAQCHGGRGGGSEIAPSLLTVSSTYIDLVLRTNRMPPGDLSPDTEGDTRGDLDLSPTDRLAVVAFTEDAFGLEGEIPEVPEGSASRGLLVWGTHCAACHGAAGQGGVAGGGAITPMIAGLDPVTIAEAVRVGPFEMPRFSSTVITDQEVGDIAAFMEEVAEEPGTPLGLTELNPVYLSGLAGLLALVVLLSCLWLAGRPVYFRGPENTGVTEADDADRPAGDA